MSGNLLRKEAKRTRIKQRYSKSHEATEILGCDDIRKLDGDRVKIKNRDLEIWMSNDYEAYLIPTGVS